MITALVIALAVLLGARVTFEVQKGNAEIRRNNAPSWALPASQSHDLGWDDKEEWDRAYWVATGKLVPGTTAFGVGSVRLGEYQQMSLQNIVTSDYLNQQQLGGFGQGILAAGSIDAAQISGGNYLSTLGLGALDYALGAPIRVPPKDAFGNPIYYITK